MIDVGSSPQRLLGIQGTLLCEEIESQSLQANALGDSASRLLPVYLPPGYDPEGSARYPTLYCLHAFGADASALLGTTPWTLNAVQWLDRQITTRRVPPAILVIVDGFTSYGGSQYVNSALNGDYATYVTRDVIGFVERRFRCIPRASARGLFGKSSGGFGTLHLVMEYPGLFATAAAQSADAYFPYCYTSQFTHAQRQFEQHGGVAKFVATFQKMPKKPHPALLAINIVAMSAAYSPKPQASAPLDFDLPFDPATGELREDIWERWLRFDPARTCTERLDGFKALRRLHVECGRRDQYTLDIGARILAHRLREAGVDVQHEEFNDDHSSIGYRHEVIYPALLRDLDVE
ncbi:MAG: hypothetical protein KGM44_02345 [bacterium]|nr:hypothetical protein [bacterium]